tara:strand:- start:14230 stop:15327 length:1098 start_codon:yes stop_codon:yes gene_type:complete
MAVIPAVSAEAQDFPPSVFPQTLPPASGFEPAGGLQTVSPSRIDQTVSVRPTGGTEVPMIPQLTRLLAEGGVPKSLEEFRQLERQQKRVSDAAVKCTVSVTIGQAQGCGVIITGTGYVLTAAHVAMRPNKPAIVTLSNGRHVSATTLGMNKGVDAGLIRIDPGQNGNRPWDHATLGTSSNLVPGMWCVATGHPGGYDPDRGPVTRVGRILAVKPDSLYTDCALIGGDSGGPLFDIAGRLIAVHSRIGNAVADNLHVPIDHYDKEWDRMARAESWGYLEGFKPVLGVRGRGNPARIDVVKPGSPAEAAEFKQGDIVIQFGDVRVTDFQSLVNAVSDTMPGERVDVWVDRQGKKYRLDVEIGREDDT